MTTIWADRERLGKNGALEKLFALLSQMIAEAGLISTEKSIVDAIFVEVPNNAIRRKRTNRS